jgi:hypothetical protein
LQMAADLPKLQPLLDAFQFIKDVAIWLDCKNWIEQARTYITVAEKQKEQTTGLWECKGATYLKH